MNELKSAYQGKRFFYGRKKRPPYERLPRSDLAYKCNTRGVLIFYRLTREGGNPYLHEIWLFFTVLPAQAGIHCRLPHAGRHPILA
jgi:hypothetical protein